MHGGDDDTQRDGRRPHPLRAELPRPPEFPEVCKYVCKSITYKIEGTDRSRREPRGRRL
jgi:hypothetical protein